MKDIKILRRCLTMRRNFVNYALGKDDIEQEEKKPKRLSRAKRDLVILATVGIGTFVLGRSTGFRDGFRRGFDKGILHTVNHFADGMEVLTNKAKESKGE